MRFFIFPTLVFAILVTDSAAVSSLDLVTPPARIHGASNTHAVPLVLMVTSDGAPLGGLALTAQ